MEYIKAIILGLVQGFTEFLPVSSSGHLVLFGHFLGFEQELSFEIFVHLGTLIAVLIYFRKDLIELVKATIYFQDKNYADGRKMILWLFIATAVTGVIGIACKDLFVALFNSPIFVAFMLSVTGLILFISDKFENIKKGKAIQKASMSISLPFVFFGYYFKIVYHKLPNRVKHVINLIFSPIGKLFDFSKRPLLVGFGQALAITPGISRSGTTIVFALLAGLKREHAARFSFLLSIPAILGAALLDFRAAERLENAEILIYLIGFITAFISGYFVIKWFMNLIVNAKLRYFSYYCWAVSLIAIILLLTTNP